MLAYQLQAASIGCLHQIAKQGPMLDCLFYQLFECQTEAYGMVMLVRKRLCFTSTQMRTLYSHTDLIFIYIPAFVTTPTSVNATLGSTATFTCSATIGTIDWRVNGSLLTELNRTNIKTSYVEGTHFMNLPATKEYNNTAVVCEVILRGPLSITISDPAVLRVQGMFCL